MAEALPPGGREHIEGDVRRPGDVALQRGRGVQDRLLLRASAPASTCTRTSATCGSSTAASRSRRRPGARDQQPREPRLGAAQLPDRRPGLDQPTERCPCGRTLQVAVRARGPRGGHPHAPRRRVRPPARGLAGVQGGRRGAPVPAHPARACDRFALTLTTLDEDGLPARAGARRSPSCSGCWAPARAIESARRDETVGARRQVPGGGVPLRESPAAERRGRRLRAACAPTAPGTAAGRSPTRPPRPSPAGRARGTPTRPMRSCRRTQRRVAARRGAGGSMRPASRSCARGSGRPCT